MSSYELTFIAAFYLAKTLTENFDITVLKTNKRFLNSNAGTQIVLLKESYYKKLWEIKNNEL